MYQILLYDEAQYIRSKVKSIVKRFQVETFEAGSILQLNRALNGTQGEFDLILADLNFDNESVVIWFEKYLELHPFTPLIIYTSTVTRSNLASGLRLGAKDYILKSSEDDFLIERIMKHLQAKAVSNVKVDQPEQIVMDLQSFLTSEIRKAQKGRYEVSICLSSIQPEDHSVKDEKLGHNEGSIIIQKFKTEYWETDVMFQFGVYSFVSFFPFCGHEQVLVVDQKLQNVFQEIKRDYVSLRGFGLVNNFVTFPHDGENKQEILKQLEKIMQTD
ncbi:response regulator [Fusibacter ferrireducens]|uniref:Stage 0 sporulation protein A homolog n=1 Tax=Fusibacter ferrireducens TaxID=2785058 RepID=A0ABR9ZZM3_9FIRM|nr:response regulator [Fusibacter ferrireducens]MBF4695900.1 response regulator [Fusibacter ferrireducens]